MAVLHFEFLLWKCFHWTYLKYVRSRLILASMSKNISYKLFSSHVLLEREQNILKKLFCSNKTFFKIINLVKDSRLVLLFK